MMRWMPMKQQLGTPYLARLAIHSDGTGPHRGFAGHSKWANIRHKKGAADVKRGKLFVKICKSIEAASQKCSGDVNNFLLSSAIDKAKTNNVPKANIEAAVERGASGKTTQGENVTYEGVGPGGVAVVVEALTDNRKRTAPHMRAIFSKHGGTLGAEGSVTWQFDRLGCCEVPIAHDVDDIVDSVFSAAVDAGAQDVELVQDGSGDDDEDRGSAMTSESEGSGSGSATARVLCPPNELAKVRNGLVAAGHPPTLVELVWQRKEGSECVELEDSSEASDLFGQLLEALDDDDDVQIFFHNAAS
jgi:YebC/PmpR family DNA-binding regulatory protein